MAEVTEEPAATSSMIGPALLAGLIMLLIHAAASSLLTVTAAVATPGTGAPGGVWEALLWTGAVLLAAGALRPVLRRTARPWLVGLGAGLFAGAAYVAIAVGLSAPGDHTPLLWARSASMPLAAAAVGALTPPRPGARES